ncbi:MAG: TonB-dependent receptor [Bacteroidetes bacterium]|jgi:Fe(3+) dicitrate transport protein|nr:TonB-dependent receptor [Bacteroidota bacterium]
MDKQLKIIPGILLLLFILSALNAQEYSVTGKIIDQKTGKGLEETFIKVENRSKQLITNSNGYFSIHHLKPGIHKITIFAFGYEVVVREIEVQSEDIDVNIEMNELEEQLAEIFVEKSRQDKFGMAHLRSVEGMSIYASRKNEVVLLDNINANKATNNSRQIYARVPGLNIWESDAAGLQLGIGGRGLSPKRTSNFNTRQNGYDISADAMGYPESYYTPPAEALEKIEIVRGAASLQYGTQFGGMVNFDLRDGPADKKMELTSRQSVGSYGLFNSYNSLGGTVGNLNYYTCYHHKQGNGWRPNTSFGSNTAFINLGYTFSENLSIGIDFTFMDYQSQQPGGLTDDEFREDPSQSNRERNWFKVTWNLPAFWLDYRFSPKTKINLRTFGLIAERSSLGYLGRIDRPDPIPLINRDLIYGAFNNWGTELRFMQHYNALFGKRAVLLLGSRYYIGHTVNKQGYANDGYGADFTFLPDENLKSSHQLPSTNWAFFAENVIHLSPKLSLTPGIRFEYINTESNGYYNESRKDFAGNVILELQHKDSLQKERSFVLVGLGASYKPNESIELYANLSQNYRAINFNDLRIDNPNLRIDENLKDEKGYNAEIGMRGNYRNKLSFDASLFYLKYNNRINGMNTKDTVEIATYRFRTNVGDSRSVGIETYMEADLTSIFKSETALNQFLLFSNFSVVSARYVQSKRPGVKGNEVEFVPPVTLKTGLTYRRKAFSITCQYAYTHEHFSDASNAAEVMTATSGLIPSYAVMDLSARYTFKFLTLEAGINNLTNESYFTFRATGYPGPGIIPSEPRAFYTTLQIKLFPL